MAVRADRFAVGVGVLAAAGGAVLAALAPLLYSLLVDAAVDGTAEAIAATAVVMALAQAGGMGLRSVAATLTWNLFESMTVVVDQDLVDLTTRLEILEDVEDTRFQDRLTLSRTNREHFQESMSTLLYALLLGLQLLVTVALLATVAPLLLLLPLAAAAPVLASRWTESRTQRALRECLPDTRSADGLALLAFEPRVAGELRVLGLGDRVRAEHDAAWRRAVATQWRAELVGTVVTCGALVVFTAGFAAALLHVTDRSLAGQATLGEVILVLTAGQQLHSQLGSLLANAGALFRIVETMRHLVWMRRYVEGRRPVGTAAAPGRLTCGIELRGVSFRYPGADRDAVSDVSLLLLAGAVVALVGDNGAGKSTLVTLLAGLHRLTSGSVLVDGTPADELETEAWRSQVTAALQEFVRYELLAREAVGLGWVARVDDDGAVREALRRADVADIEGELPQGLETPLGSAFLDGVDLSGGQWQKLALARSSMRPTPLLRILDEPTYSLDIESERHVYDWFAGVADRESASGSITVIVSHRFSTVRTADLVVVMDDGRVREVGTHAELIARGGRYAEMYRTQAVGYRE
ncbi:ABC transporter ATP-binding protein [Nocardioides sp. SYSU D00038]|uniref:ATP-binding cassette domain-containing protein n=1 Tax=Nocardioides sp. SYSU D00038 TaxID=2812554 RepID=UPI001967E650|nr:ABC transporter ATP-binding protein [Nocardioides sp. SYSU D00038]